MEPVLEEKFIQMVKNSSIIWNVKYNTKNGNPTKLQDRKNEWKEIGKKFNLSENKAKVHWKNITKRIQNKTSLTTTKCPEPMLEFYFESLQKNRRELFEKKREEEMKKNAAEQNDVEPEHEDERMDDVVDAVVPALNVAEDINLFDRANIGEPHVDVEPAQNVLIPAHKVKTENADGLLAAGGLVVADRVNPQPAQEDQTMVIVQEQLLEISRLMHEGQREITKAFCLFHQDQKQLTMKLNSALESMRQYQNRHQ